MYCTNSHSAATVKIVLELGACTCIHIACLCGRRSRSRDRPRDHGWPRDPRDGKRPDRHRESADCEQDGQDGSLDQNTHRRRDSGNATITMEQTAGPVASIALASAVTLPANDVSRDWRDEAARDRLQIAAGWQQWEEEQAEQAAQEITKGGAEQAALLLGRAIQESSNQPNHPVPTTGVDMASNTPALEQQDGDMRSKRHLGETWREKVQRRQMLQQEMAEQFGTKQQHTQFTVTLNGVSATLPSIQKSGIEFL